MTPTPGPHERELIQLRDAPNWDTSTIGPFGNACEDALARVRNAIGALVSSAEGATITAATESAIATAKRTMEVVTQLVTVPRGVQIANGALGTARRATLPEGSLSSGWATALQVADTGAQITLPGYGLVTKVTGFDPVAQVNSALAQAREAEAKRQLEILKAELDAARRAITMPGQLPPPGISSDPPDPDDFGHGPIVPPIGKLPPRRPTPLEPGTGDTGTGNPGTGGGGDGVPVPPPGGGGGGPVLPPNPVPWPPRGDDPVPWPPPQAGPLPVPPPGGPGGPGPGGPGPGGGPSVDSGGDGSNRPGPGLLGAGAGGLGLGIAGKLGSSMMGGPGGPIASHSVNLSITNPNGSQVTPGSIQGAPTLRGGRGLLSGLGTGNTSGSTGTGSGLRNTVMGGGGTGPSKKDKPEPRTGLGLIAPTFEETPIVLRSRGMMAGSRKPATQGED